MGRRESQDHVDGVAVRHLTTPPAQRGPGGTQGGSSTGKAYFLDLLQAVTNLASINSNHLNGHEPCIKTRAQILEEP
jgi:hypothetical protein